MKVAQFIANDMYNGNVKTIFPVRVSVLVVVSRDEIH